MDFRPQPIKSSSQFREPQSSQVPSTNRHLLQERLRAKSQQMLDEAMDAFEPADTPMFRDVNLRATRDPIEDLRLLDIIDFHQAFGAGEISLTDVADPVLQNAKRLQRAISEQIPSSLKERKSFGQTLACFLACVFIPCAAFQGRYSLALDNSLHLLRRFTRADHGEVLGMGNQGGNPPTRHLMISPVMDSLCIHSPKELNYSDPDNHT